MPLYGAGALRSALERLGPSADAAADSTAGLVVGGSRSAAESLYRSNPVVYAPPMLQPRSELRYHTAAPIATLLDALKQLRLILARERRVPAYAIFPDRTLIDMAARKPATPNEFAEVHGVGAAKLNDFADTFLATIRNHRALPG